MDNHINQVGSVMLVEKFQELVVHQKPLTNKAPGFFCSWLELLIFQTYFTKSKTQTDDRVTH